MSKGSKKVERDKGSFLHVDWEEACAVAASHGHHCWQNAAWNAHLYLTKLQSGSKKLKCVEKEELKPTHGTSVRHALPLVLLYRIHIVRSISVLEDQRGGSVLTWLFCRVSGSVIWVSERDWRMKMHVAHFPQGGIFIGEKLTVDTGNQHLISL